MAKTKSKVASVAMVPPIDRATILKRAYDHLTQVRQWRDSEHYGIAHEYASTRRGR